MGTSDKAADAAIDTVANLATNVYSDVVSPAMRRTGAALDTLFKIGLSPVSLLDWGFEHSKAWLMDQLQRRLAAVPTEFRQAPPSQIAIPILLAIASTPDCDELRNLYAELLLKATDSRTASMVHPSYASVLGQLTPQEALVFLSLRTKAPQSLFIDQPRKYPAGAETIEGLFHKHCLGLGIADPQSDVWLQNLLRLRLLEMTTYTDAVYRGPDYEQPEASVDTRDERHLTVTEYGAAFIEACAPLSAESLHETRGDSQRSV